MTDKYIQTVFQLVMERIKSDNAITSSAFNLWFGNCKIVNIDSKCVYLAVENETKRKSILTHYKEILVEYFRKELGFLPEIEIEIDKEFVPRKLIGEGEEGIIDFSKPLPEDFYDIPLQKSKKPVRAYDEDHNFYRRTNDFTFENYVVGSSNTFAYSAARAVAEKSSREFNPFFIYGPSGIGKTHLLYAIANKMLEIDPSKKIVYVKGEEFTNNLIDSIKEGTMSNFRQKYRSADVLLVDDIQFIAGKNSSQEEFFHTFDVLYENNKQIIMTSDKPPAKLEALTKRLSSRFENGLIADIEPPDFELRIAILRKKAQNSGLMLSDEILEFLADKLHTNIREIEGIIKKLAALNFLSGITVDMDIVKESIKDFIREDDSSKTMVEKIISETSEKFEIPVEEIIGRKRDKHIQIARNVSMYIIREMTELSLPEIGMLFQRKHSTVKSNIDSLAKMLTYDVYLEKSVDEIMKAIRM
ncbi:MAG: chromosomal replication initiator protein DnaA [Ruminococcaceae bacterium]|nr:chromosomal replication initiator protein DnaA [Oscillospiraceae bacterium]